MGSIIKGICEKCGYETKDLYYGGGFANFTTCCDYPTLDKVEKELTMANIMDKKEVIKQNPNLVFYDNKALIDKDSQKGAGYEEWGEYKLYNQGYLCPKCNKFKLGFSGVGCWD